jgi:hypothetical protein
VYGWIWRHIPVRQAKFKALISLIVIAAIGAVLWYKVFPAVEPILPFDDGQIENSNGQPADGSGGQAPSHAPSPSRSGPAGPASVPVVIPS